MLSKKLRQLANLSPNAETVYITGPSKGLLASVNGESSRILVFWELDKKDDEKKVAFSIFTTNVNQLLPVGGYGTKVLGLRRITNNLDFNARRASALPSAPSKILTLADRPRDAANCRILAFQYPLKEPVSSSFELLDVTRGYTG